MENGWLTNLKNPMWNKNKRSNISKGLLLTVVLFCFSACKNSLPESITSNHQVVWDTTMPNPTQYLLFGNGKKKSTLFDSLSIQELDQLQEGDILLRKGFGSISDFIVDFLDETYPVTHCGFVVNTKSKSNQVLHTASNKTTNNVYIESLEQYVQQSALGSLVLVRLNCSDEKKEQVLHKAYQLLEEKIPFDMGFDDTDKQALYCIELMRNVFLEVFEEDLLPKRTHRNTIDVLSMDNFFNSAHFEVIFNHFDSVIINRNN
jgi:hypothetical protein